MIDRTDPTPSDLRREGVRSRSHPARWLPACAVALAAGSVGPLAFAQATAQPDAAAEAKKNAEEARRIELSIQLKDIADDVDDAVKKSAFLPRKTAEDKLAALRKIVAELPLTQFTPLQQSKFHRAMHECLLAVGRPADALQIAEKWATLEPAVVEPKLALYEATLATGDSAAAVKAYRRYLQHLQFQVAGQPAADPKKKEEFETQQEKFREMKVDRQKKLWSPVGRTIPALKVTLPDKTEFAWKKGGGKPLVIAVWNAQVPSSPTVLEAYKALHAEFGAGGKVAFLSINELENVAHRPKENEAIQKAELPGASHQEIIQQVTSIYQGTLGRPPFPLVAVVGADGVVRYSGGPDRTTAREAAFAVAAALESGASATEAAETPTPGKTEKPEKPAAKPEKPSEKK